MAQRKKINIRMGADGNIEITKSGPTKRKIPGILTFPLWIGALVGGGYMDIANNQPDPSVENSNPAVVEQYQEQVSEIAALKDEGQNISEQATDFFTSVYVNSQLSEADVQSLTDQFTAKVAPPATLSGGYVLEHPEFLDEAKVETRSRNLGALDQATMSLHKEAMDDGPWGGVFLGWLAFAIVINLANAGLNAGANLVANRQRKKPKGPYGGH